MELSVSLEFACSDACLSFLSHDLVSGYVCHTSPSTIVSLSKNKLERSHFYDGEEANNPSYQKNEITTEICHAAAPFAFSRYHGKYAFAVCDTPSDTLIQRR